MQTMAFTADNFLKKVSKHFGGFPSIASYDFGEELEVGRDWRIKCMPELSLAGYYTLGSDLNGGVSLLTGKTTMMSLTPMEIESHLIAQHSAKGRVVVAGLGLGMIVLSMLRKPAVERVVVLDVDPDIFNMFPEILGTQDADLWEQSVKSGRLVRAIADCKEPLSPEVLKTIGKRVDYLWVDIWSVLGHVDSPTDTKRLVNQLKPKVADFWGCEVFLAINTIMRNPKFTATPVVDFAKKTGIPFSLLAMNAKQQRLYTSMCYMAARNQMQTEKRRELMLTKASANSLF